MLLALAPVDDGNGNLEIRRPGTWRRWALLSREQPA
jgi:hypothetical protein